MSKKYSKLMAQDCFGNETFNWSHRLLKTISYMYVIRPANLSIYYGGEDVVYFGGGKGVVGQ